MKLKNINKKIKKFAILGVMGSMLAPTLAATPALAKDASHQGMSYLQVKLSPSTHHIESSINGGETGNNWAGSDIVKTQEYKATGLLFSKSSYNANKNLNATTDFGAQLNSGNGSLFSDDGFSDKWEEKMKNLKFDGGRNSPQTENLTMSFPGWGGGDRAWDVSTGGKGKDRNADNAKKYRDINSDVAVDSAQAVSNTLIPEFNKALDEFYSKVENGEAELSDAGMANMVWLVANGYFPDPSSQKLSYDSKTGAIGATSGKLKKGKVESTKGQVKAGGTVSTITSPRKSGDGFSTGDQKYTYRVWKGYDKDPSNKYDNLYLSWADVALSATAFTVRDSGVEVSDNTTVVGDQVNSLVYSVLSGALGALGVKKADDLVFKSEGNLFRNGTWQIYAALMTPFVVMGLAVLSLVVFDAWRKANLRYLTTGNVQSIQNSVARVFNAIVMMLAAPMIVAGLVALDTALVGVAAGLNAYLAQMAGYSANTGVIAWAMRGLSGIVLAILLAFVNIKYTWRYIARSITFGIYYMTSPLMFAIDSLKGDGGLLQYGQMTGEVWKNLIGTIFQRTFDAFGLAIALNLGKIIFGDGVLITILGYFAIESITNALMSTFGVTPTTIKGMAEAGQDMFKRTSRAVATGVGAKVGAVALAGRVGYHNQRKIEKGNIDSKMGDGFNSELGSIGTANNIKANAAFKTGRGGYGSNLSEGAGMAPGNNPTQELDISVGPNGISDVALGGNSLFNQAANGQGFDSENIETNGSQSSNFGQSYSNLGNTSSINNSEELKKANRAGNLASLKAGAKASMKELINPQSTLGAAFMGGSQLTPGHLDDFLGGVLLANNAERILDSGKTDEYGNPIKTRNRGALGTLGDTTLAKMMGFRKPLEVDTYEASQERMQSQLMKERSKSPVSTDKVLQESGLRIFDTEKASSRVALNHSNLTKSEKEGYSALTGLTTNPKMAGIVNDDGEITRDALVNRLVEKNGAINKSVESALGFMDSQGFNSAYLQEGQEAEFTKGYTKLSDNLMTDDVKGTLERAGSTLTPNSAKKDSQTGIQYVKDGAGNVTAFTPDNVSYDNGEVTTGADLAQRRASAFERSDSMQPSEIKALASARNIPEFNKVEEQLHNESSSVVNEDWYGDDLAGMTDREMEIYLANEAGIEVPPEDPQAYMEESLRNTKIPNEEF